jgi:hypothetical protein
MGIKLGDISPLAGAISGKGMFGKGLGAMNRALGPMAGIMPRLAGAAQKKDARRAATAAEAAAMQKAEFDANRRAAAGEPTMRKGGKVKKMAKGGSTASKRADGIATQGKTRGKFV